MILLTTITEQVPYVQEKKRAVVNQLGDGICRVLLRYGFMEDPNVPRSLEKLRGRGLLDLDVRNASFFLGRERVIATEKPGMATWREKLFSWMARNATGAPYFFHLPPDRVVELGAQIEI